jgi:DNA-binding transcriptional MerR regulator
VYGDVLTLLRFVTQERRLGFSLAEIRDVTALRRAGQQLARMCRTWCA